MPQDFPQRYLIRLRKYRSRHESLIAFSNAKFYGNDLLTFPSPSDIVSEVKWVNVDGYYDKGKTKQNKAEAEAVAAELRDRGYNAGCGIGCSGYKIDI